MPAPYVRTVERCAAIQTVSGIIGAACAVMAGLIVLTTVQHSRVVHGHRIIHWPHALIVLAVPLVVSAVAWRVSTSAGKWAAHRSLAVYNTQAVANNWNTRRTISYTRRFYS